MNDYREIMTNRLIGRALTIDHLDLLAQLHQDPELMEMMGGVQERVQVKENLEKHIARWALNGFGYWLYFLKDTDELVGRSGISKVIADGQDEIDLG